MGYGYPVSVPMVFDVPEGQRTARPALRELPQMEVTGPSSLETLTDLAAAVRKGTTRHIESRGTRADSPYQDKPKSNRTGEI